MTLKTPIYLFPVMLNISVESTELPRPQSRAITCWGTKEVIVSLPSASSTLVPIIPLRRSRCFLSRFLLSLQCSSLSLGKPVEEAVNGEPPSTHRGINTIVNSVTTSHHGLTRITRKVENTERGSTIYN